MGRFDRRKCSIASYASQRYDAMHRDDECLWRNNRSETVLKSSPAFNDLVNTMGIFYHAIIAYHL